MPSALSCSPAPAYLVTEGHLIAIGQEAVLPHHYLADDRIGYPPRSCRDQRVFPPRPGCNAVIGAVSQDHDWRRVVRPGCELGA